MSRFHTQRGDLRRIDQVFGHINQLKSQAKNFLLFREAFRNYLTLLMALHRERFPVKAVSRNGEKDRNILVSNLNELLLIAHCNIYAGLEYDKSNDLLTIRYERLLPGNLDRKNEKKITLCGCSDNGDIVSIFLKNEFDFLPVEQKIVVDIGANIGDSCIYFCLKGADRVIGLEPFPANHILALRNIESNNLSSKVDLMLAGLGGNRGHFTIDPDYVCKLDSKARNFASGVRVPIVTLAEILDRHALFSKDTVLKVDCEGCEYESILNASRDDLRTFSHIQIEYHYGYRDLKNKLEKSGFKVKCSQPVRRKDGNLYLGFVCATRT